MIKLGTAFHTSLSQKMSHITIFCCKNLIISSQNVVGGKCAFRMKKLRMIEFIYLSSRVKNELSYVKRGIRNILELMVFVRLYSNISELGFSDWIEIGFYTNPLESLDFFILTKYIQKNWFSNCGVTNIHICISRDEKLMALSDIKSKIKIDNLIEPNLPTSSFVENFRNVYYYIYIYSIFYIYIFCLHHLPLVSTTINVFKA